jgi:hypothetical protein
MSQFYQKNNLLSRDKLSPVLNYYQKKYTNIDFAEKILLEEFETKNKKFLRFILKYLPAQIKSYNDKNHFKLKNTIPTIKALKTSLWIEYNQSWLNMLIFDLDYKISIDEAIDKCLEFEYEPTFVCKTDKGCHIGFALENMVSFKWTKAINLARYIKHEITKLLSADINASHRIKGIWRNPLLHEHYFSGLTYNLDDFKYLLLKQKKLKSTPHQNFKKYLVNKQRIELNNFSYRLGNRNAYLWYMGMGKIKDKDYYIIYNYLYNLNIYESLSQNIEKLLDNEITKIAYSILKYNEKETNYVSIKSEKKPINNGAMEFEKIKRLNYNDYKNEVKRRQQLSAKRTNNIIDHKDNIMTRQEAAANMRKVKSDKVIKKLENSLRLLSLSNEKLTISKIARTANITRNTVSKYIDRYKNKDGKIIPPNSLF